jgi:calcineurin-like phosphoesterase family protein
MTDFVTSDIHFGHKNIMNFCPETRARFKNNVEFMNAEIIREWNELIKPEDHTYILGDIAFCATSRAVNFLHQMNGAKTLIIGNHDTKLIKDNSFRYCFEEITPYKTITFGGTRVCMFHYPICEWDQMHRGSVHFHGHLHGGISGLEGSRALDVGMDATGRVAVPLEEMVQKALQGEIRGHHQKGE